MLSAALVSHAPAKSLPPGPRGSSAWTALYNRFPIMSGPRYALVAYVRKPVGQFVETLRRDLHPELPHLAAHLTILPPRLLQGTETSAIQELAEICRDVEPFEVTLGE